ncbi:MAG TPA: DNA ligase, partial [Clostridium sp.]|nr:DNA ligase [Clostridium sp.]
ELLTIEKMGEKSVQNLLTAIEASKKTQLHRFIYSLGIRGVGETTAKMLCNQFLSLEALMNAELDQLKQTPEVGDITAEWIYDFFRSTHNIEVINRLLASGITWEQPKAPTSQ